MVEARRLPALPREGRGTHHRRDRAVRSATQAQARSRRRLRTRNTRCRMTGDTFDRFSDRPRGRFGDNESQRADRVEKSNLCDLDLILHNDNPTKLAIAVSLNPDTPFAHWA